MTDALDMVTLDEAGKAALYRTVLEHMIRGGIRFSVEVDTTMPYVAGKSYVPTEYTNFAAALVLGEGQGSVIMGNYLNESAPYVNSIDVEIMSLLKEPQTDAALIKGLADMPIYETSHGKPRQMTAEEYLPIGLSHVEMLGFLKRK